MATPLKIVGLRALEILDSRGRPTLEVEATISDGSRGRAKVPSGASTGKHEALELRDEDADWHRGMGVRQAVRNVEETLGPALRGYGAEDQEALDRRLIGLAGGQRKAKLGANAVLGVSCAVARARASARGIALYKSLAEDAGFQPVLPVPMINILSGGLHAGGQVEFQDFLVIPHGFDTLAASLEAACRIHERAGAILRRGGYLLTGVADEGGWGPVLDSNEEAIFLLTVAIAEAGFTPGDQVSIAIDVASTHFRQRGAYHLSSEGRSISSSGMVEMLAGWVKRFPLVSIEDGLAEDDWKGWSALTAKLGGKTQIVGDDLFTTNPRRLERGLREKSANAVLVKMNQIGTLSETFRVCRQAKENGLGAVVSARSGETEDAFLADLAVATGAGQIKIGSITRSERLAKYNRLLELEAWDQLPWRGREFRQRMLARNPRAWSKLTTR